jgi:large subunit ribosomal protein L21
MLTFLRASGTIIAMKYAVIKHNGKQFKVSEGDVIQVEGSFPDKSVSFDEILMVGGDSIQIGTPAVKGAKVTGTVLSEVLGPKIRVAKFKAKSNYHRAQGYRSKMVRVRIDSL